MPEYYKYLFSSPVKDANGNIDFYIKSEHTDIFKALLQKIPHTVNFSFRGVLLDRINWYGEEAETFVFKDRYLRLYDGSRKYLGGDCICDHSFYNYSGNRIEFSKTWGCGNKYNPIVITIDCTRKDT